MEFPQKVTEKLAVLTARPGVYLMKDREGTIIYVGKAKNLKNRVSTYFTGVKSHTAKVMAMVANTVTAPVAKPRSRLAGTKR